MLLLSQLQGSDKKHSKKEDVKHEEYDGSKAHADVYVLYVFDMFERIRFTTF